MFTVQTVRLYPTELQQQTLDSWMSTARRVWNHYLEHRIKSYKRRKQSAGRFEQFNMLTKWRKNDKKISAVPLRVERDAIDRLQKAFDAFFRRLKANETPGFPRFKGRGQWRSLNFSKIAQYVRCGMIAVPKLGLIPCRNLRGIVGIVKGLRVVKRADRWFAQLLIDNGNQPPEKTPIIKSIGIDLGLTSFAAMSDGEKVAAPKLFRQLESKLRRAHRSLSRKKKGSKRRLKAKKRLARIYLKIADQRSDFTHRISKRIVKSFDLIVVEDLNIKAMRKGRFSKSIADAGWGQFLCQLSYKAERAGKTFVRVDAKGTTQLCSSCGEKVPKTIRDRVHDCPHCGLKLCRDLNAARNILQRGVVAVGDEFTHGEIPTSGRCKSVDANRGTVKS